jgi:hypothetical protein
VKGAFRAALVAAVLLLAPTIGRAQVYGQFTGAETVPMGGHVFGAYLHASQDIFGLLGQLRLSFYPNVDFGFHGGITRIQFGSSDRTTLRLGGDVKFQVIKAGAVDLSAGGAVGVETGDEISVLTIGPTMVASKTFPMGATGGITPYAGLGLLFSNVDVRSNQTTDFSVPFRFGSELKLSPELKLVAEIQLRANDEVNDDFSFLTGVNLPF